MSKWFIKGQISCDGVFVWEKIRKKDRKIIRD